ncbi:hypothetical protein HAX54_008180 [Datura stramonium]|uniref:Uncharacterized protein n=1 Tax=Datura stramonium TaxID=4076 RepID=A0ABS8RVC0_DATST|nr:hypothetical protein [Datura stramonium]
MATFTSFASVRMPNLQSGDRLSIFRSYGSKKIHKFLRCNVENSTSNSSNNTSTSTSTSSQASKPENLLLKIAWYGSEFLGIAASIFRSPTGTEAPSEGNLELAADGSGFVDRALVVDTIKDDFQRSYFVTGNLTLNAYEEKCEFADPAGSFKGLSRFKRNCTNFGYLVERSNMKLMKWEDFEEKAIGHWRFSCTLSFPWKPILSATGYTEYYFNEKSGKVCRHIEHWNVPKMALLKQIIRPSRGRKASG